jgi:hypothetical protein
MFRQKNWSEVNLERIQLCHINTLYEQPNEQVVKPSCPSQRIEWKESEGRYPRTRIAVTMQSPAQLIPPNLPNPQLVYC